MGHKENSTASNKQQNPQAPSYLDPLVFGLDLWWTSCVICGVFVLYNRIHRNELYPGFLWVSSFFKCVHTQDKDCRQPLYHCIVHPPLPTTTKTTSKTTNDKHRQQTLDMMWYIDSNKYGGTLHIHVVLQLIPIHPKRNLCVRRRPYIRVSHYTTPTTKRHRIRMLQYIHTSYTTTATHNNMHQYTNHRSDDELRTTQQHAVNPGFGSIFPPSCVYTFHQVQ